MRFITSLSTTHLAVISLLLASILWGLSWIPLQFFRSIGIEGMWLLAITHAILVCLFITKGWQTYAFKQHYKPLLGITFFGGSAIILFTLALTYGDVVRMMVLFYLLPVWGVFGGRLFLNEKMDRIRWCGVICAVVGAYVFLGGHNALSQPVSWLDLLALLSGLFFAANNLIFRAVEAVPISTKLLCMFIGCASISFILGCVFFYDQTPTLSPTGWGWLFAYTLLWLVVANVGSQWAVTKLEAGRASIILIMELVAAILSTILLTKDMLTINQWFGCMLVVIAGYLEATRSSE